MAITMPGRNLGVSAALYAQNLQLTCGDGPICANVGCSNLCRQLIYINLVLMLASIYGMVQSRDLENVPTYATRVYGVWYSNQNWIWDSIVFDSFLSR